MSTHLTKESDSTVRIVSRSWERFRCERDFDIFTRRAAAKREFVRNSEANNIGTSAKHKSEPMLVSSDARHIFPDVCVCAVIADATTQLFSYATTYEHCSALVRPFFGTNRIMCRPTIFSLTRASGRRTEKNGNKFCMVSRFHASAAALACFHVSLRTFSLHRHSDATAAAIYVRPTLTSHLKVEEISRR